MICNRCNKEYFKTTGASKLYCSSCTQLFRRKKHKEELVAIKGGRCQLCGYDKCIQALEFHHTNPKEKDFQLSANDKGLEKLKEEVDKCILVCSNCHREIHGLLVQW